MNRILLTTLLLSSIFSYSQDIIHKKGGGEIEAKIITFGTNNITYKIWEYQKAPSQKISTSEVKYVEYQNGTIKNTDWYGIRKEVSKGSFTDPRDSITYKTITFAGQTWMAENLRSTKTTQGKDITWVVSDSDWVNNKGLEYCYYNNDPDLDQTYGCLYNWVTAKNVCPVGWHLPSDNEWTILINNIVNYLGVKADSVGGLLKATGTLYWNSPNEGARNKIGFSALPGGIRNWLSGGFVDLGSSGYWWGATEGTFDNDPRATARYLSCDSAEDTFYYCKKSFGFSVRCVKDKN